MPKHAYKDSSLLRLLHFLDEHSTSDSHPIIPHHAEVNSLHSYSAPKHSSLRKASVLIPIIKPDKEGVAKIIFTLRSENLNSHAGQVSLPGGSRDASDSDDIATALRESQEEIGLDSDKVEVIGQLADLILPSGFCVTPVIALVETELTLNPCPIEVAEIFTAPLALILDLDSYTRSTVQFQNKPRTILEINHGIYRIWGATAAILYSLAAQLNAFSSG